MANDQFEYDEELHEVSLEEAKKKAKKREEEEEEEEEEESGGRRKMEEETLAAKSLHPKAAPGEPMGKVAAMAAAMTAISGMSKEDLNKFAATMAQFGPGKDYGVGDKSAANQSTIDTKLGSGPKTKDAMPKLGIKEDLDEMFNGYELTEDFKVQASALFEAAITARVITETARLEEEFETKLNEELSVFTEEVTTKLDTYLDYVVEHWMKENEVAIESTLRNEIAEDFINGLKNLFAEHYISVPQEQVDVLEALASKVEALEQKLDETISENVELKNAIVESTAQGIFEELASDLALTQQEKFAALVEGIEFDGNLETYEKKLKIVKENYFKTEPSRTTSNIEEETFEGEISESTVHVDPSVNRYVQALARTVKK